MADLKYIITHTDTPPSLDGAISDTPWAKASRLEVATFPWAPPAKNRNTELRILYDQAALYLQFHCQDAFISAIPRELNGDVCVDSCVELFFSPLPGKPDYVNFETNCCGQFHMGFGPQRHGRVLIPADLAQNVQVKTSIPGLSKEEHPDDNGWWLAARIPFDTISQFVGQEITPKSGDCWPANVYRCGGSGNELSVWSLIGTPKPDYHRPEYFSPMIFG